MNTSRPLRVGIIGASATGGWARESHVPAVLGLDGMELTAVATRSRRSADDAAATFGASRGYGDATELILDEEIDVVTVGVRVPAHRELVLAAIAAGKHVLVEWPLGRTLAEAEELHDAATEAGVHAAIGLQARMSPAVLKALELIADGSLGRILGVRLYDSTVAFGPATTKSDAYLEDAANGATHISIHGGHSVDLVRFLTGELTPTATMTSVQFPEVAVEGGEAIKRTIPDHLLVLGRTREDAPVSVEVVGGRPADDTPFRLDVLGSDRHLALVGGAIRGFQSGRLRLLLDGEEQTIDDRPDLPEEAANVAGLYAALRDDIASDRASAPNFADAVELSRLIVRIEESSTSSATPSRTWPGSRVPRTESRGAPLSGRR